MTQKIIKCDLCGLGDDHSPVVSINWEGFGNICLECFFREFLNKYYFTESFYKGRYKEEDLYNCIDNLIHKTLQDARNLVCPDDTTAYYKYLLYTKFGPANDGE